MALDDGRHMRSDTVISLQKRWPKGRRMPEGVTIRARAPSDCDDLYELFNEPSFLASALMRDPFRSPAELNAWLNGLIASKRYEAVVVSQGRCIGYGALYVQGEHFDHCGILMLGFREAFRGKRIGDTVLSMLIDTARHVFGLSKLQLTVTTDNVAAVSLYKKHGFEIEGLYRRFARRGEVFCDAYAMALLFNPEHCAASGPGAPVVYADLERGSG